MSQAIKTPHLVVLENGETFTTEAHIVSENRYFDGVDHLYFETKEGHKPSVDGTQLYHTWNCGEFNLTAWVVPMEHVKQIKDVS